MEYVQALLIGLGGVVVALAAGMVTWSLVRPVTRRVIARVDLDS